MSADILPFRKKEPKPTPHPEYEAWAAAREQARLEFEREQLLIPPNEWSRPTNPDLNVDWGDTMSVPTIIALCCFIVGFSVGILVGIAAVTLQ